MVGIIEPVGTTNGWMTKTDALGQSERDDDEQPVSSSQRPKDAGRPASSSSAGRSHRRRTAAVSSVVVVCPLSVLGFIDDLLCEGRAPSR